MSHRALLLLAPLPLSTCDGLRAVVVENYPSDYAVEEPAAGAVAAPAGLQPVYDGLDAGREQLPVRLVSVVGGIQQPTDLQFVPGDPDRLVILEKEGAIRVASLDKGAVVSTPLELDVRTKSEQGLLGLAFHPDFAQNGRFYVNHVVDRDGTDVTRVAEFVGLDDPQGPRVILDVEQPYANHNAGQLAFGPEGALYIGLGDGGWRDDPKGHGQNARTMLGSMLRIDVDARTDQQPYGVPSDNPFLDQPGVPPETWAIGLRNPWRYAFDPTGRLIVADVGQNTFEEIGVVGAGDNLGWRVREGRSCFPPDGTTRCPEPAPGGLQDPVYVYGRDEGVSVTGGFVYTGSAIPALKGRYVFGDFVSGRIWAISLPEGDVPPSPAAVQPIALGRFPILPSSFGQGPDGELYVADFKDGAVYRIQPGG